jgi:hypothetical protein
VRVSVERPPLRVFGERGVRGREDLEEVLTFDVDWRWSELA